MAIMTLPIFTSNAEDIPDIDVMAQDFESLDKNSQQATNASTANVYNEKISGVFADMHRLGYI